MLTVTFDSFSATNFATFTALVHFVVWLLHRYLTRYATGLEFNVFEHHISMIVKVAIRTVYSFFELGGLFFATAESGVVTPTVLSQH